MGAVPVTSRMTYERLCHDRLDGLLPIAEFPADRLRHPAVDVGTAAVGARRFHRQRGRIPGQPGRRMFDHGLYRTARAASPRQPGTSVRTIAAVRAAASSASFAIRARSPASAFRAAGSQASSTATGRPYGDSYRPTERASAGRLPTALRECAHEHALGARFHRCTVDGCRARGVGVAAGTFAHRASRSGFAIASRAEASLAAFRTADTSHHPPRL